MTAFAPLLIIWHLYFKLCLSTSYSTFSERFTFHLAISPRFLPSSNMQNFLLRIFVHCPFEFRDIRHRILSIIHSDLPGEIESKMYRIEMNIIRIKWWRKLNGTKRTETVSHLNSKLWSTRLVQLIWNFYFICLCHSKLTYQFDIELLFQMIKQILMIFFAMRSSLHSLMSKFFCIDVKSLEYKRKSVAVLVNRARFIIIKWFLYSNAIYVYSKKKENHINFTYIITSKKRLI